ncbi:MAG: sigma-70 family RNA polymerase sigma factor [Oscillospiraceae bacterium]|nr:sigma-70 family RNA polymerase sigma factor [Oscillospiraceae bacterium]
MNTGACHSIEEVVRTYHGTIARIAFHYVKDRSAAEDIAQEIYMKWLIKRPDFASAEDEKAWLIRLTVNLCKNQLSAAWARHTIPLDDTVLSDDPAGADTARDVLAAVLALPEKYRTAVYLFYYEGYPSGEIARILGQNDRTIRTRLARARKILKERLGDDYG